MFDISPEKYDSLREILNIGVGKSADILNTMLGSHIALSVPELKIVEKLGTEMFPEVYSEYAVVNLPFRGDITGTAKMVFPSESALKMVKLLTSADSDEFDAIKIEVLSEIGNIVLNSVMGMFSNTLKTDLHYSLPWFQETDINNMVSVSDVKDTEYFLLARVSFKVEKLNIKGDIMILFKLGSFEKLDRLIDNLLI